MIGYKVGPAHAREGEQMESVPTWARRYTMFVGLPALVVSIASFLLSADSFAQSTLTVSAFLVFASAGAIRAYYTLHAMGRGDL